MLDDRLLDGLGQVFPDVPPVRDVNRVRGAESSGLGVCGGPVTADHLDAGVAGEPGGHRRRGPVGQQINRTAPIDVHQDRAVVASLAQGELVHPEHPRRVHFGLRQTAYQPQERRPARPDRERVRQAGAGPARQHHRYLLQHRLQPGASPSVPEGESVDLLGESGPPAGAVAAAEPPDL